LWVYQPEGVNDDFAFYGLDGVNYDGNGAGRKLLERLLRVYIDRREPATKTGMRVVPADDSLLSTWNTR
jgi:hypothetical protein